MRLYSLMTVRRGWPLFLMGVFLSILVTCSGAHQDVGSLPTPPELPLTEVPPPKDTSTETPPVSDDPSFVPAGTLGSFDSDAEFAAYMGVLEERIKEEASQNDDYLELTLASDVEVAAFDSCASCESVTGTLKGTRDGGIITNNQELAVDEGDIVKKLGDHLVILRKGRLYAVSIAEPGILTQSDTIRVARDEALNATDTYSTWIWYDELLVTENKIVVLGFRYFPRAVHGNSNLPDWVYGATEINTFLFSDGKFERGKTMFIESNDYYSSRNYASRLVDGRLLIYMPHYAFLQRRDGSGRNDPIVHIPTTLAYGGNGEFSVGEPLFSGPEVFKPPAMPVNPTFHTILACGFGATAELDCSATSIIAEPGREFYVSGSYLFLWTGGIYGYWDVVDEPSDPLVYALSLQGLAPAAHRVRGTPIDQFSFKQLDGQLHILVTRQEPTEIITEEYGRPVREVRFLLELITLDLTEFNESGDQAPDALQVVQLFDATGSPYSGPRVGLNRYAEGWFLADVSQRVEGGWEHRFKLVAHRVGTDMTRFFDLESGSVVRIEPLYGFGALVVTQAYGSSSRMDFLSFALGEDASRADSIVLEGARQGEWRSHGFFFKPGGEIGLFALPVVGNKAGGHWWGNGISNIAFFRVDRSGVLGSLGAVSASPESSGECETSCIDWYGNTRPIFVADRAFALMGSEIHEISLSPESVTRVGNRLVLSR